LNDIVAVSERMIGAIASMIHCPQMAVDRSVDKQTLCPFSVDVLRVTIGCIKYMQSI